MQSVRTEGSCLGRTFLLGSSCWPCQGRLVRCGETRIHEPRSWLKRRWEISLRMSSFCMLGVFRCEIDRAGGMESGRSWEECSWCMLGEEEEGEESAGRREEAWYAGTWLCTDSQVNHAVSYQGYSCGQARLEQYIRDFSTTLSANVLPRPRPPSGQSGPWGVVDEV